MCNLNSIKNFAKKHFHILFKDNLMALHRLGVLLPQSQQDGLVEDGHQVVVQTGSFGF